MRIQVDVRDWAVHKEGPISGDNVLMLGRVVVMCYPLRVPF
jgi:hypothetical protein